MWRRIPTSMMEQAMTQRKHIAKPRPAKPVKPRAAALTITHPNAASAPAS